MSGRRPDLRVESGTKTCTGKLALACAPFFTIPRPLFDAKSLNSLGKTTFRRAKRAGFLAVLDPLLTQKLEIPRENNVSAREARRILWGFGIPFGGKSLETIVKSMFRRAKRMISWGVEPPLWRRFIAKLKDPGPS